MEKIHGGTGYDLAGRLLDFAVRIIKPIHSMQKTTVGKHVGGHLFRSGTSPGSHYEESRGAKYRSDLIHKLGMVLKGLKESRFWLRVDPSD